MSRNADALFYSNQLAPRAALARMKELDAVIEETRAAINRGGADIEKLHYQWGCAAGEQGAIWFAYSTLDTPRAALKKEYRVRVAQASALARIREGGGADVKRAAYDHGVNVASASLLKAVVDTVDAA